MASPRTSRVLPPGVAHSRRSALLMLAALIAAQSPLPYTAAAMIPLVWAGVESVLSLQALISARSWAKAQAQTAARTPARGIIGSVISLVLVSVLALVVLLPYAFYGTFKSRQECTLAANTAIATADCNARFSRSIDSTFGGLLSSEQHSGG